jgi:hypothetical protein
MSDSEGIHDVSGFFLTKDETEVLDLKFKAGIGEVIDIYERKIMEVENDVKEKIDKILLDKKEILFMIEEQKSKKLNRLALKRGEEIVKLIQKKKLQQKQTERQEQVKRNLEAFKEDCERQRNHNNGE